MGKVRVKTLGIDEVEEEQKKEAKKRVEKKRTAKAPGLKGGERVVAVGPSEEEIAKQLPPQSPEPRPEPVEGSPPSPKGIKPKRTTKKRTRSKRYQLVAKQVDRTKTYPLEEALALLPKLKLSGFDETVELHVTTIELGVSATVNLPHGTGKKIRVAIANDELLGEVEKGNINFDVLIATPMMMPKLAKVAKFLGPRGLMPNPKRGTVSDNPEEAAKKYEGGHMTLRTESKAPLIHLAVGKLSFGQEKLIENIKAVLSVLPKTKVKKVTLKSTMSPGVKIDVSSL